MLWRFPLINRRARGDLSSFLGRGDWFVGFFSEAARVGGPNGIHRSLMGDCWPSREAAGRRVLRSTWALSRKK